MMNLAYVNDYILGYGALKNDLLFHKIPKNKYLYYIESSLKIGKEKAKKLKAYTVEQLCQMNHIDISYAIQNGKFYGIRFRANIELGEGQRRITLYKDSLEEITKAGKILLDSELTLEDVIQIHLAHELFHFYEYIDKQPTNERLDSITRLEIGPIKLHATIMSTCEIAAHAFAKELLQLNYLPNIYDYLLLINKNECLDGQFQNLINEWNQEIGEQRC